MNTFFRAMPTQYSLADRGLRGFQDYALGVKWTSGDRAFYSDSGSGPSGYLIFKAPSLLNMRLGFRGTIEGTNGEKVTWTETGVLLSGSNFLMAVPRDVGGDDGLLKTLQEWQASLLPLPAEDDIQREWVARGRAPLIWKDANGFDQNRDLCVENSRVPKTAAQVVDEMCESATVALIYSTMIYFNE